MKEQTFGEKAVGLSFNPSGNEGVDHLKRRYAELIDMHHGAQMATRSDAERRLHSIAIEHLQTAQMWSVKSATYVD